MVAEIRVILDSEEEKTRIEFEAKKLGLTQTAFLRLLFKNWVGEVKLERQVEPSTENKTGGEA